MSLIRRLWRIPLVTLHLIFGATLINLAVGWDRLRGRSGIDTAARRTQRWWCLTVLRIMGVQLRVDQRELHRLDSLLVSNHVSWLDIPVIAAIWPACFLSKSEIKRWPFVGRAATGLGTLYIQRGKSGGAERAAKDMAQALRSPRPVIFFPEGTTSDGSDVLPFRPRLYQSAVEANALVVPVALRYTHPDGRLCAQAAYVGDQSLIANVWAISALKAIHVYVHVGEPIEVDGHDRRALASRSQAHVREAIALNRM